MTISDSFNSKPEDNFSNFAFANSTKLSAMPYAFISIELNI